MSKSLLSDRPEWLAPMSDPKSELILRAAFDVFQEHGLHNATMLDVAKRARVSKETIYARFDSKEDLFYALIAWGTRQSSLSGGGLAQDPIADPVAELRTVARALVASMMHPESIACYRMAISESGRNPEIGRTFDELGCAEGDEVIIRVFNALLDRGLVEAPSMDELRDTFIGLVRGNYHHMTVSGSRPMPTDEENIARADRAVEIFMRAYAPAVAVKAAAAA